MRPAMGSTAADKPQLPDAEQIARFARDLKAIWPSVPQPEGPWLGLAVSGGPDSTALLLIASAAFPGQIEAVSVDHGLRPESAGEAAWVARLCKSLDVPHRILGVEVAAGNIQAEARRARYGAMGDWVMERGLMALATGHHADDQAETLLLRLNRASGAAGLAGTRERGLLPGTQIPLLRPLLGWRRAELAALVETAGICAIQDPGNRDDRFDRVRMRKALAEAGWLDVTAIAESARNLSQADEALEWAAQREWRECVRREALGLTYRPQAPRAVAIRVIARIVTEMGEAAPRGSAVARLFDALVAGNPGSIGNLVARPVPEGWRFARAPKRRKSGN